VVLDAATPPPGLRERLIARERPAGLTLSQRGLLPWARWQTPAVEPRRFDAWFFVAELPAGALATSHAHEHVEHRWLTPAAALAAAARRELRLPPPQLRTLWELAPLATPAEVMAAAARRAAHVLPLMPRARQLSEQLQLLFPWDVDYASVDAEGTPWPADHPLAAGPSRVTLADGFWRLA
jgi:hypothetical protein